MGNPRLLPIIAHARAGATAHAWRLLEALSPQGSCADEIAALRGRLLKDKALRAPAEEKAGLLAEAADAYSRAAGSGYATYPLINSATLHLLSGNLQRAQATAHLVLERLEAHPEEPETPYYRVATRAEALLLLSRNHEASVCFAQAISFAPRAWEDHASTLRQLKLILEAQGRDAACLDAYRPPRTLHFSGHMSFDPKVERRDHLDEKIAEVLNEENIGFAFGALAAGADIIVAEALLERGAELNAILPGGPNAFAAASVDPYGPAWRKRFDAVLDQAATVRTVRPLGAEPDQAMVALADEIAMGAAAMNGRRLESSAVQLLVLPEDSASASDRSMDRWAAAGWRQRLILAPRETRTGAALPDEHCARRALAMLALSPASDTIENQAVVAALLGLKERLAALPSPEVPPYWSEGRLILAYGDVAEAGDTAVWLIAGEAGDAALRIGGHYGVAASFTEPFSGGERLALDATGPATAAMDSTPPGTACVTEDFAAALAAAGPRHPATEYVGELDAPDRGPPMGLYALKSYDQLFQPLGGDDAE